MEQHGDAMSEGATKCPFCGEKSASLKQDKGRWWFKCFRPPCPSATSEKKAAWDEVGYLMFRTGLNRSEAFKAYLKEAGVWREERLAPSVMPGQRARRQTPPEEDEMDVNSGQGLTEDEERPEGPPQTAVDGPELRLATGEKLEGSRPKVEDGADGIHADGGTPATAGEPPALPANKEQPTNLPAAAAVAAGGVGGSSGGEPPVAPPDGDGGDQGNEDDDEAAAQRRPTEKEEEEKASTKVMRALREFYELLILTPEDEELIWRKRGLPKAAGAAFGFKSSLKSNLALLESLRERHAEVDLVAAGLYQRRDGRCRPASQMYGMGNTGKKDAHGDVIWDWVHPILIPYFNEDGEVVALRPHKGGVEGMPSRLFIARFKKGAPGTARSFRPAHCVITEGEFKACALYWAFEQKVGTAALPGISQSKNYRVMEDLKDWIRNDLLAEKIVVAFDNEEKGNPKLPGFKPDKRKRYDADIWGQYLALRLGKEFGTTLVCRLPEGWRDKNGKADWDGALAEQVRKKKEELRNSGLTSDEVWVRAKASVQREFKKALSAAQGTKEMKQAKLFSSEEEKIIKNGVERLFYEPRLPNGGEKEKVIAQKLIHWANTTLKGQLGLGLIQLATQYRETFGWYYTLKALSDAVTSKWLKMMLAEKAKKDIDRNHDLISLCELRLKGIPTLVANFRLDGFFTLVRADGKRDRVVEITTAKGERSGRIRLDAESLATPSGRGGFRVWLENHGNGCWRAGERELQDLQLDLAHELAFKDVHEVTSFGWYPDGGLWFMGDCCYHTQKSKQDDRDEKDPTESKDAGEAEFLVDRDGVYWHDGTGYMLAESGNAGQPWAMAAPLMHPDMVLQDDANEEVKEEGGSKKEETENGDAQFDVKFKLVSRAQAKEEEWLSLVRLFIELKARLHDAIGSHDAYVVLGSFLAFFGRPEFFKEEKCFPGLICHGETGHGKSTTMQWMMEVFGFHQMSEGIAVSGDSSPVGLQILLEQYSCLPGWLSDFSNTGVSEEKQRIMHGAYSGAISLKWTGDGTKRKPRTMFVIDGESRPNKTSTRYRYAQVLVSKANRKGNQVPWFERNRRFFLPWGAPCCADGKSLAA